MKRCISIVLVSSITMWATSVHCNIWHMVHENDFVCLLWCLVWTWTGILSAFHRNFRKSIIANVHTLPRFHRKISGYAHCRRTQYQDFILSNRIGFGSRKTMIRTSLACLFSCRSMIGGRPTLRQLLSRSVDIDFREPESARQVVCLCNYPSESGVAHPAIQLHPKISSKNPENPYRKSLSQNINCTTKLAEIQFTQSDNAINLK